MYTCSNRWSARTVNCRHTRTGHVGKCTQDATIMLKLPHDILACIFVIELQPCSCIELMTDITKTATNAVSQNIFVFKYTLVSPNIRKFLTN